MSAARKKSLPGKPSGRISVRFTARVHGASAPGIRRAVRAALVGRVIESVSVAVVDDATIADLHKRYMKDPEPTDVLSFDLRENAAGEAIEGEIVVSAETARRSARRLGLSERQETLRYVIHGALHLAGWDDQTAGERRRMRREEDRVLGGIGEKPNH